MCIKHIHVHMRAHTHTHTQYTHYAIHTHTHTHKIRTHTLTYTIHIHTHTHTNTHTCQQKVNKMQKVEKNSSSEHLGGRGEKVKQIKHSNTYSISPLKITNLISSHRGKAGEAVGGVILRLR